MKALSIRQPWASLIANGVKRAENRTWRTNVRGTVAIHAGRSRAWLKEWSGPVPDPMPMGAIVAVADIVACVHVSDLEIPEMVSEGLQWLSDHEYASGPYCFVLANARKLEAPVPCTGALGFWTLPFSLEREIVDAVKIDAA